MTIAKTNPLPPYAVELDGGVGATIGVANYNLMSVQVVPLDYSSTTGEIEVKWSVSGNPADAVSFATAVKPDMTSREPASGVNIRDAVYIHVTTTADSSKRAEVYITLIDSEAPETIPFDILVSIDRCSGVTELEKFGYNSDVDTGTAPEDVWEGGGLYTGQPAHADAAETVEVFSSSANDAAAGTGARTLRVEGLDANFAEQSVDVTLNGTTPVATTETWKRVFRAYTLTAGSGGENAGTITIRHTTTTSNVFALLEAGSNQTQIACYTVPAGKAFVIKATRIAIARLSGAAGSSIVRLLTRSEGGVYRVRRVEELTTAADNSQSNNVGISAIPEKTDIIWRVSSVSDNSTSVSARFSGYLIDV